LSKAKGRATNLPTHNSPPRRFDSYHPPLPRRLILQKSFNVLTQSISTPKGYASFLRPAIVEAAEADDFTGRLLQIADDVFQERYSSAPTSPSDTYTPSIPPPPVLGILRHDYMLHEDGGVKQVEVNTIASR